jgi:hypothetical protein
MRSASLSFRQEIAFPDEFFQAQFHGARFAIRECHDLAEGEGFVIGKKGDDLFRERVEVFGAGFLEGDLFRQSVLLFHEGAEKEQEPSFPVGLG